MALHLTSCSTCRFAGDSEGPGKVHCWVADALHLLPSLQAGENSQASQETFSLPVILTLDASRPWELSAQVSHWAHQLTAALQELDQVLHYHLIVCLNKTDTLMGNTSAHAAEGSEQKWTNVLPESMVRTRSMLATRIMCEPFFSKPPEIKLT